MEHLQGETLADRLKKGPLPLDQALRYAIEISDALDKAHRQAIVHRDLKPPNIFLVARGAPPPHADDGLLERRLSAAGGSYIKLLDFGLAKLQAQAVVPAGLTQVPTGNVDLTAQGTILGTIQYMAPEQLEGQDADARSDIFALGAVLYEMVTAKKAFEGKSQASLMASILERDPRPISELQPLSPPALDHVIQGCLAKAPDDRWQTAHDVMKQLKWVAAGSSQVGAAAVATAPRRGRWGWIAAAGLVIVLVAASTAVVVYMRRPEAVEQTRFSISTPPMPNPTALSVSPDGRRIAFAAQSSTNGASMLFVRSLDSVETQLLAGTEGAALPFWSPDGRSIGFAAQGKLKRIDIAGGPPQNICDVTGVFVGGTWNADGVIVYGTDPGALKRVSAAGGEPAAVTVLDEKRGEFAHMSPFFLPDGRNFLFYALGARPEDRAIYVGSLESTDGVQVLRTESMALYAPPGYLLFHRSGTLMAQPFDANGLRLNGEPTRIADNLAIGAGAQGTVRAAFAVSNKGVLLYRTGDASVHSQLAWYDRTGKKLGTVGLPVGAYRGIALSPDNKRIAVHQHQGSGGDIWVWDSERGTFTRLTFSGSHNIAPMWSPDGNLIAFASDRDGGLPNIYQKSSRGAGNDEPLLKSDSLKFPEDWAPDGQSILYATVNPGSALDIFALPLSGDRKPKPVVNTQFTELFSKFSPDGQWVAYASAESGRLEVYVQPYGQRTGKWQISTQGGNYARWSRNGKELFYLTDDGTVMAVDVQTEGSTFRAGTPRALFKADVMFGTHGGGGSTIDMPYDVSADGQRFLINERLTPASQGTPITVVLNWTAAIGK